MNTPQTSYLRSFWIGLAGFVIGGLISGLATYLIFASGVFPAILKLVPAEQTLVRLGLGIVFVFVGIGLGGAVGGLLRGHALRMIDQQGSEKRYLVGGAYSTWVSQGILAVPILLLIGLISLYNNGSQRDPTSYIVFFAFFGGLFGLLNGAALSLITLRIRYAWLAFLGYLFASLLAGAAFGLVVWRYAAIAGPVPRGLVTLLFLILAGITIYGIPGGLTGLIYAWLSRKRTTEQPEAITPRRWQDIMTITIFTLLFLFVASFINRGVDFITKYPGSTTTSLSNLTEGVHWQDAQVVSNDISTQEGMNVGLAAGQQAMAISWTGTSGEIQMAFEQFTPEGYKTTIWSTNVSRNPEVIASHSQLVLGNDNTAYVVWSENGEIWFNQCQEATCGEPINLSASEQPCVGGQGTAQNDWPVMAIAADGTLMAAWQAGNGSVIYMTWASSENPSTGSNGCLASELGAPMPRLATGVNGTFWMVTSAEQGALGNVSLSKYGQGKWSTSQLAGEGSSAEVYVNSKGKVHLAWCSANEGLVYLAGTGPAEIQPSTTCQNRPSIFEDGYGRMHLVYATSQWLDNFGNVRQGQTMMETILLADGWSEPAIIGPLFSDVQQEAASSQDGDAELAWVDVQNGSLALQHARQPIYKCDESTLTEPIKAVLDLVQNGQFHPADYRSPFCGNHFVGFIYMPYPAPGVYTLPAGDRTGYDQLSDLIIKGQYEILLSNMQWDKDENNLSPGSLMARTITNIYQQVKANPAAYPRGMTIKILLGNYPSVSNLENGDQIWNVVEDLGDAGLPAMEDPSIGWKVELANYKGSMPHSHTKFMVIDGKTILAAGFNIAWTHLPHENPSGKGQDQTDLGVVLSGPAAQTGIAAFDDEWRDANQLVCNDLYNGDLRQLQKNCTWKIASISHLPESLKYYLPGDTADAVSLYRTAVYKEADQAYGVALSSAQKSIDVIHVNFTAELICDLDLIVPGTCGYENTLPYLHSIVDAMKNNGVQVRVIMEGTGGNGLENLPNIRLLQQEAAKYGVEDQLEMRVFNGKLHTKSAMIDDELLFVGSQNFHYSSIWQGGVSEFVIATDAPQALATYQEMFDYYWQQAIPLDEWKIW